LRSVSRWRNARYLVTLVLTRYRLPHSNLFKPVCKLTVLSLHRRVQGGSQWISDHSQGSGSHPQCGCPEGSAGGGRFWRVAYLAVVWPVAARERGGGVDGDLAVLCSAAATTLVTLMTTDSWERVKAGFAGLWRRVHPGQAAAVEADLE